jgi:hypothetical protein
MITTMMKQPSVNHTVLAAIDAIVCNVFIQTPRP